MNRANNAFARHASQLRWSVGFTLLELIVAMLAAGMLLVGLSSALFLTLQATQPDIGGHDSRLDGGRALVDLTSELRFAKSFTLRTDKSVEFTVADRTGDSADDTIRWEWSGVAGDPLTRGFNGGTSVSYLDDVHHFQLNYNIKSLTTTQQGSGPVTSDEFMLANFEGWSGVTPTNGSKLVGTTSWVAEYTQVQGLPTDLTSMAITKVSLRMRRFSAIGMVQIGIHETVGGGSIEPTPTPTGTIASIDVLSLPLSVDWVDIPFSNVTFQQQISELVIVVKATVDNAAIVAYLTDRKAPSDATVMIWTTNSGANWDPSASKRDENDVTFRLYGTYTTVDEDNVEVTRYFAVSSDCAVQVRSPTLNRLESSTEIVNQPEVVQP